MTNNASKIYIIGIELTQLHKTASAVPCHGGVTMKSYNPRHSLILTSLLTLALLLSILQPLPVLDDVRGRVIYAEDTDSATPLYK